MCSILGVFGIPPTVDLNALRRVALECSRRQRHRGPDATGVHVEPGTVLIHERLATIDLAGGRQPLRTNDGTVVLAANGEIYNHRQLRNDLCRLYEFVSNSDCEVISALYCIDDPLRFMSRLNGMFSFALWDRSRRRVLIARDRLGLCPLYWGYDSIGLLWVASEMKALLSVCATVSEFPPGYCYTSDDRQFRRFDLHVSSAACASLAAGFERAVSRQSRCDVPLGVVLSSAPDSWVTAACAVRHGRKDAPRSGARRLQTFAIGLEGSTDLVEAQAAADALGTLHSSWRVTSEELMDALPDVIWHIESHHVADVRTAIPLYLLSRRMKASGIKVGLIPAAAETFADDISLRSEPHSRMPMEATACRSAALADKAMMAWGVEARVPSLDLEFLSVAAALGVPARSRCEAIDSLAVLLPQSLQSRVSRGNFGRGEQDWADALAARANAELSDKELTTASARFQRDPPTSKEMLLYRTIFERYFVSREGASSCAQPYFQQLAR
jgi:asparagine synthase (glutamine-hydrolysing)